MNDTASNKALLVSFAGFALVVLAWLGSGMLIPDTVPHDTADGLGYSNVEVSDRSYAIFFSECGKGDIIKWEVTGTNPAGKQGTFTVCAGLFKGGTARF